MRRTVVRLMAVAAVSGAGLVLSAGPAQAAAGQDLGSYSSWNSCGSDARSNGEQGFPGTFYCAWNSQDGTVHQYYAENIS